MKTWQHVLCITQSFSFTVLPTSGQKEGQRRRPVRAVNHAGGGGEEALQIRRNLAGLRAETPQLLLAKSSRDSGRIWTA